MSKAEINEARKLSEDKPSITQGLEIIAIGRLYWAKNFELIFDALNLLQKDKSVDFDWCFHMIGDGHLREKLEKMVDDYDLRKKSNFLWSSKISKGSEVISKESCFNYARRKRRLA
ncbi:glycosyltransferase [Pseudotenacibaculum sp. MALMAid0570]|uniref:glycosyltransferase n=1 Tax=Pseudotenacibaculum sp. MALMAid0570 TaxID=3143938 RepID=UPI0032DEA3A8